MSEIRPTLPNVAPSVSPGPREAARAAQAAFFRAALGQQGVAQAAPSGMAAQLAAQAAVAPAPMTAAPASTIAPVERYSRPGALLDIRV